MNKLNINKIINILKDYRLEDEIISQIFRACYNAEEALKHVNKNFFGIKFSKQENLERTIIKTYKMKSNLSCQNIEIIEKNENNKVHTTIRIKDQNLFYQSVLSGKGSPTVVNAVLLLDEKMNFVKFEEIKLYNYNKESKDIKARNKAFLNRRATLIKNNNAQI